jgi:hypothetical protein
MSNATPFAASLQCGRCRLQFPAPPGAEPATLLDWWACPECSEKLFPGRARRATNQRSGSDIEQGGTTNVG